GLRHDCIAPPPPPSAAKTDLPTSRPAPEVVQKSPKSNFTPAQDIAQSPRKRERLHRASGNFEFTKRQIHKGAER
ncbi:hypothetical protein QCM80_19140, partial [Bradyrhizobium sp. SSUT112]|uniref:hypothetical protein n=1 Tax=Bradyrhizobium sp. SSUT112 TaxID=3040604 RepID=UPI00244A6330